MAESQRNRPSNQWVHTVRTAMASDSSRTWFDAKVQEHGFDFLDDYLDRILAQAKQPQSVVFFYSSHRLALIVQRPIIELVKTPGRRRNPQTKGRSAVPSSSRLRSVLTASIEVWISDVVLAQAYLALRNRKRKVIRLSRQMHLHKLSSTLETRKILSRARYRLVHNLLPPQPQTYGCLQLSKSPIKGNKWLD